MNNYVVFNSEGFYIACVEANSEADIKAFYRSSHGSIEARILKIGKIPQDFASKLKIIEDKKAILSRQMKDLDIEIMHLKNGT